MRSHSMLPSKETSSDWHDSHCLIGGWAQEPVMRTVLFELVCAGRHSPRPGSDADVSCGLTPRCVP